jgi:hypothetical protein
MDLVKLIFFVENYCVRIEQVQVSSTALLLRRVVVIYLKLRVNHQWLLLQSLISTLMTFLSKVHPATLTFLRKSYFGEQLLNQLMLIK